MIKTAMMVSSIMIAGDAAVSFGAAEWEKHHVVQPNESFEACTFEGPCALRVTDSEGRQVWLVRDDSTDLTQIWDGEFWLVSDADYLEVSADLQPSQRFTVPAKNPTTGLIMERKGSTPKTGGTGGSGIITVNAPITIGGGNPCAPCHTGSWHEIHKEIIKKPDGGK
jgi:hypothetical protein